MECAASPLPTGHKKTSRLKKPALVAGFFPFLDGYIRTIGRTNGIALKKCLSAISFFGLTYPYVADKKHLFLEAAGER
jgi:hypothetical protein